MFSFTSRQQWLELLKSAEKTQSSLTIVAPSYLCTRLPLTWILKLIEEALSYPYAALIIDTSTHRGRLLNLFEMTPHINWHFTHHLEDLPPGIYWYQKDQDILWLSALTKE